MKIAVRYGHQITGQDGGAVGYVKETDVNRRYGALVISKLQALGNEVLNVTPPEANRSLSDSLNYGINKANEWGADLFISCHVNAFQYVDNAMGCEVVVGSQRGYDLGTKVVNGLSAIGFKSRGAKYDTRGLAEIRETNMPCIICEPFFLDSKFDVDLYNKVGDEGIANAIVKGICGQLPTAQTPVQSTPQPQAPIQQPKPHPQVDQTVLRIQQTLNRLRVRDANGNSLVEDGIMGSNTKNAIIKFQSICDIEQDGIWGNQSQNCVDQIFSKPLCGIQYVQRIPSRYIQWRLGIGVDGVFGSGTRYAVIRFQSNNGLDADGVVGNITWSRLIG